MSAKTVALDLDGVLVDFVRGAFQWHKKSLPYEDVRWDFDKALFPDDARDFWNPLGYDFWASLDWTPNGKMLLARLFALVGEGNVTILSSPCETIGSNEGKIAWIKRCIPQLARSYFLSPCKTRVAATDLVLIDDADHNVKSWRQKGPAVLVPQPWNAAWLDPASHTGHDFNVDYVMKQVEALL